MNVYLKCTCKHQEEPLTKGSVEAAGYDIRTNEPYILTPGERHAFSTGIHMKMERGYYCRISPRSGLAFKYGVDVLAGVIDSDYTGEIKVILINHGKENVGFKLGDRIAQLIFYKLPHVTSLTYCDVLPETIRGADGFGSTGYS
jgi:dUTP pyrophosphatase